MKTQFCAALLLAVAAPLGAQTPGVQAPGVQAPGVEAGSTELEQLLADRPVVNEALTPERAVAIALRESPVVRGASEEVEAALGQLNAARAERRPMLSANTFLSGGSIANIVESPVLPISRMIMNLPRGGYFDQNLMLMMPLSTGGRLQTLVRQAAAARDAAQAELEGQRQEVALLARLAFREAQARRALVEVQQARLREDEERLRVDRARLQQEQIPAFTVLRDEAEAASSRQEVTNAERDVELALLQLKTVMGVHPASNISVAGALEYQPSADFFARLTGAAPTGASAMPRSMPPDSAAAASAAPGTASSGASAPPTGSTAPGAAAPGSEVPGATALPSSPPGTVPDATAPETPAPASGSAVPPLAASPSGNGSGSSANGSARAAAGLPAAGLPAAGLPAELTSLLRLAQRQRTELRAAGLRVTSSQAEAEAIGAAYRPQVNAFVMGDIARSQSQRASAGTTFGVAASVPLFTGGRKSAALQTARAQSRRQQHERERVALQVAQEVNAAYLNLRAAEQNILTARAALRSAQEDYRVALVRYQAGRSIVVEVLDALAARTRAQSNLVQAMFGFNVEQDRLLRSVGQLDAPSPLAPQQ